MPVASSEEATSLRELVSRKFPFLEYAVCNVLYHADVASGQGISQEAFMERFALGKWIMLDNLFNEYQVHRHTPNASLLYIVAEKNFSNLVRIQVELDMSSGTAGERLEKERYPAPLYAALANVNVNKETIEALFSIPVAQTYDSGEPCEEYCDCEIERNRAAVATIIEKRPDVHPSKCETLVGWAASNGHEAVVSLLLSKMNANPNSKYDGFSPLSSAAKEGHAAIVKLLLVRDNIDLNPKDRSGKTPLLLAAERGHKAVVKMLLARDDTNPNSSYNGDSPLSLAAMGGHAAVVEMLLARDDVDPNLQLMSMNLLSLETELGDEAQVKRLFSKDEIDPKPKHFTCGTPLASAVEYGHEAVVEILLARDDIDPNPRDDSGKTPLSLAAARGHEAVVEMLLARNDINPNLKDNYGRTPLWRAVDYGCEAIVKILLARDDIDLTSKDKRGETPLSLAKVYERKLIIKLLQAKINTKPNHKVDCGPSSPLSGNHHA